MSDIVDELRTSAKCKLWRGRVGANEMSRAADRIEELEKLTEAPLAAVLMFEQVRNGDAHLITHDQIAAAVEVAEGWRPDPVWAALSSACWAALNELNIKRCEECGGAGEVHGVWIPEHECNSRDMCPTCNGKGYTVGGE